MDLKTTEQAHVRAHWGGLQELRKYPSPGGDGDDCNDVVSIS